MGAAADTEFDSVPFFFASEPGVRARVGVPKIASHVVAAAIGVHPKLHTEGRGVWPRSRPIRAVAAGPAVIVWEAETVKLPQGTTYSEQINRNIAAQFSELGIPAGNAEKSQDVGRDDCSLAVGDDDRGLIPASPARPLPSAQIPEQ